MPIQIALRHVAVLAASALSWLSLASDAAAQECQADSDCNAGYHCATNTGTVCSSCPGYPFPGYPYSDAGARDSGAVWAADAGAATDSGIAWPWFPEPFGDAGGCDAGCSTYEYRYCAPATCASDADCPAHMACHTETWLQCSSPACRPGLDCDKDAGSNCSEQTQTTCRERYSLPCQLDPECGEGFECNKDPYTICWGSGGVIPNADGGFTVVDGGTGCTTETPDAGYCNLLELPCESSADCPAGLSCQTNYNYPPCTWWPGDGGFDVADSGFPVLPGKADAGFGGYYECPPPVLSQVCRPESWGGGGSTGGSTGGLGGTGAYDAGVPSVADAGTTAPGSTGGGLAGGGIGGAGGSQDAGEEDEDDQGPGRPRLGSILRHLFGKGGCSLGAQPADGNLAWFALMSGLLVLRARRRR
jgi:hypothetical protein